MWFKSCGISMDKLGDIQVQKFITGVVDTGDKNNNIEVRILFEL